MLKRHPVVDSHRPPGVDNRFRKRISAAGSIDRGRHASPEILIVFLEWVVT
jgi:hypothetical protein